jgi:hypothetical protein
MIQASYQTHLERFEKLGGVVKGDKEDGIDEERQRLGSLALPGCERLECGGRRLPDLGATFGHGGDGLQVFAVPPKIEQGCGSVGNVDEIATEEGVEASLAELLQDLRQSRGWRFAGLCEVRQEFPIKELKRRTAGTDCFLLSLTTRKKPCTQRKSMAASPPMTASCSIAQRRRCVVGLSSLHWLSARQSKTKTA